MLDDVEKSKDVFWSWLLPIKNGLNNSNDIWLEQLCTDITSGKSNKSCFNNQNAPVPSSSSSPNNNATPKKICTVEELERGLLKNRTPNKLANLNQQQPFIYPVL